ncbi:MAG: polyprenyl synthetase family protein [Bryobacteraceae bacterium]
MSFPDYLTEQQRLVDRELDRLIPSAATPPEVIHQAMRYSLFAGGKRIRPILCLAAAGTVSEAAPGAAVAACALECIHTYSLIHDDLPALDNDDLRRGQATCHKQFGEAMAILAGDALLTVAFQLLSQADGVDPARRAVLIAELSTASGTVGGMIGGQVDDLLGERQPSTAELLDRIHRAKTGALLRASVRMGAICAGASDDQLGALTRYGEHIGLAFQIVDDILDVEQPSEALGKTAGKDAAQHKITFPAVYGLFESHLMAQRECESARESLAPFGARAQRLLQMADLIVQRTK